MEYYITRRKVQDYLDSVYKKHRRKLLFGEMLDLLFQNDMLSNTFQPVQLDDSKLNLTDIEFEQLIDRIPLHLFQISDSSVKVVKENDLFPNQKDVFVFRHFRYLASPIHTHDFFEINYVFRGKCELTFEKPRTPCVRARFASLLRFPIIICKSTMKRLS